ncbi:MAG: UDP-3-O-(3-hydroxymyristoyl)glucosamine N-acyltransferase [Brevundimonas sp.]|uniref:UDP-3-O-(3-hydroxymyristoyl)glucosamine N-acyltransferase n=1 Tax=Brevundimonas sp. TaxID=1871086 RepID=UPI003003626A
MPDNRFFLTLPERTVDDLAAAIGGRVIRGGDRVISGVAPLARAEPADLTFLSDRRLKAALAQTRAGAVLVSEALVDQAPNGAAVIVSTEVQAAWARAADLLHKPHSIDLSASPGAWLEDDSVVVEPGVVLGQGVSIGRGTRIGANTVIGPGVQIGRNCQIGSLVSLSHALIGDRVRILAGARIGEAGFGAAPSKTGPVDIPQLGRVILQDGVTVGANTCIDRGAYDDTVIGENSKIDNQVQIGHNVVIGRNGLLAAHTGISGSVTVGDNVMFGGRAGIGDHITIGEGARVAAGAGVLADIPPGEIWSGYPAKPLRQSLREAIWLAKQAGKSRGEPKS